MERHVREETLPDASLRVCGRPHVCAAGQPHHWPLPLLLLSCCGARPCLGSLPQRLTIFSSHLHCIIARSQLRCASLLWCPVLTLTVYSSHLHRTIARIRPRCASLRWCHVFPPHNLSIAPPSHLSPVSGRSQLCRPLVLFGPGVPPLTALA